MQRPGLRAPADLAIVLVSYTMIVLDISIVITALPKIHAMAVPRLTSRFGNATLLVGALVISAIGMAWLGQPSTHSAYLTGIALPMILIGAGQGGALGPLTPVQGDAQ